MDTQQGKITGLKTGKKGLIVMRKMLHYCDELSAFNISSKTMDWTKAVVQTI